MNTKTYPLSIKIFLFFCLSPFFLLGQVTITGVVVDAHSKESVPFANVYLQSNPTKGVAADFDGNFTINFESTPDILEVSALGYETLSVPYEGQSPMKIQLNSAATTLGVVEVVVDKDVEDPAYPILRKVIKNKPKNDRVNFEAYTCEVYNKMEIDLINITDEFKNMKLNKPLRFLFEHIDSTSEDEPFLPLFVSEALSDYFYQKNPDKEKEQIKAVKIAGDSENESVAQLLGVAKAQFNAYDNWIELIAKKFAGPIGDNATNFYRYYLLDSAMVDDKLCYQIQYFPKHKGINGFYGDFWIHKGSYAVKKLKMQLLDEVHLNFVEKLSITLEYKTTDEDVWVPKKDYITITSTSITEPFLPPFFKKVRENAPGIQAKRSTTYEGFNFDKSVVSANIDKVDEVLPDIYKKSDDFWNKNRHIELNKSEKTAYFLVDTVRNLPIINTWRKVTSTLFTGYMWGKYIDVGNIYEFTAGNAIEGFRMKLGLRTSTGISKKFMLGGYAAYGTKDKKFKFGTDFLYVFNTQPRRTFGAAYIDDYSITPNFNPYFSVTGSGLGANYFLRRGTVPFKLLDLKNLSANYFHEWESGFSVRLAAANQRYNPLFNFSYKPIAGEDAITNYEVSKASVELRYAYDETFLAGTFLRTSLGSRFPVVSLKYSRGFDNILGGDLSFDALELKITDRYRWGAIGFTDYKISGGKIWGTLPYLNLFVPNGNERYIFSTTGFNSIPEYAFATDQYAALSIDHHFDGFILQLIPLFRKMRLRAVGSFKALIGNMTDDNLRVNAENLFANTTSDDVVRILIPSQEPLMEVSAGIENIFRFFRFDAIWRLNYHELNDARFGIRGTARFSL